jgi:Na+-driven multidrug efflux pump
MNQFVLALGKAKRGMVAVIIGAIINTILDPVFIYTLGLGIQGAAIATVIAQFCVFIFVFSFLCSNKADYKLSISRIHFHTAKKILTIGSLPFFIILFDNLLVISLNFVLRKYGGAIMGDKYISCAAVVQSFMVLVFYPAQGISTGCGTLYSYHYGAGNYKKIIQVFRNVFLLCASYMIVLCIAAQIIPETFARIFVQDAEIVILSASCIRKYTLGLLGVAVQYAIVDGLTAMGQIAFAMPISFFRKILYIICVFLFPIFSELENVFYSETISDIIGASVTISVFIFLIMPKLRKKIDSKSSPVGQQAR